MSLFNTCTSVTSIIIVLSVSQVLSTNQQHNGCECNNPTAKLLYDCCVKETYKKHSANKEGSLLQGYNCKIRNTVNAEKLFAETYCDAQCGL